MMQNLLDNGSVMLRAPEPGDIDTLLSWENDSRYWSFGNQIAPYSKKNIEDYVFNYNPDIFVAGQLRFMIVDIQDTVVYGTVDLYDFDPVNLRAAVGIIIDPRHREKGIAHAAVDILMGYVEQRLAVHQLWAVVAVENIPARELFRSCGFSISGALKSWIRRGHRYFDAYIFQKFLP